VVEPLSIAIGAGVTVIALLACMGLYLLGYRTARRPESIVDMNEIQNYVAFRRTVETGTDDRDK